jgi:putative glutamine amidotransferase
MRILISWPEKSDRYARAIERTGTIPVVYDKNRAVDWDDVSGVLFTGGEDVEPSRYGEDTLERTRINEERDRVEFGLAELASERSLPMLGICRGCQLINVFFKGSLSQQIEGHDKTAGEDSHHEVEILEGTELLRIVNEKTVWVNSAHHQAVKRPGEGLRISARAPDGIIEGIESHAYPALGVQWHPERLEDKSSERIFTFFIVDLCRHK